jgi:hypothetical protein
MMRLFEKRSPNHPAVGAKRINGSIARIAKRCSTLPGANPSDANPIPSGIKINLVKLSLKAFVDCIPIKDQNDTHSRFPGFIESSLTAKPWANPALFENR